MKVYTNRAKAWGFTAIAVGCYALPLIVLACVRHDELFKDSGTSLSFFAMLLIVFFLVFCRKAIKRICEVTTVAGFTSAIILVVSLTCQGLFDNLFIISVCSIIGAVLAWYPTQIARIFSKHAMTDDGKLRTDLTVKQANILLFGLKIEEEPQENKNKE